jgi:hypothetical protein
MLIVMMEMEIQKPAYRHLSQKIEESQFSRSFVFEFGTSFSFLIRLCDKFCVNSGKTKRRAFEKSSLHEYLQTTLSVATTKTMLQNSITPKVLVLHQKM